MESQPQNPEFRNNPENVHPRFIRVLYQTIDLSLIVAHHTLQG